ncbi:GL18043 [Drosophila persimilis]|uniref:GL18043 n=1 Tax=Drosophila persimilis TaxID=7234 RepID=B4H2B3_DROPE|nr:GL18043 [Drosophila persimilis]
MLPQPPPPHTFKVMSRPDECRHYLRAFIHTYRDLPVLWDTSMRDYTKPGEAGEGVPPGWCPSIITLKLGRERVEDVKKERSTRLRTTYRKELKELDFLRNSEKFLAVNPFFKNEPSFPIHENSSCSTAFLDQHGNPQQHYPTPRGAGGQTPNINISEMFHKSFGHAQRVDSLPPPSQPPPGIGHSDYGPTKRARQTPPLNNGSGGGSANTDELNIACEYLAGTYPDEELESIARTWTHKLRRLPREQRLLAERFINEILFEAESNNLHRGSLQINNSFEPYVRYDEASAGQEEQDKSQSPSVHTSTESKAIVAAEAAAVEAAAEAAAGSGLPLLDEPGATVEIREF